MIVVCHCVRNYSRLVLLRLFNNNRCEYVYVLNIYNGQTEYIEIVFSPTFSFFPLRTVYYFSDRPRVRSP